MLTIDQPSSQHRRSDGVTQSYIRDDELRRSGQRILTVIVRETAKMEVVAKLVAGKNVELMPETPENVFLIWSSADTGVMYVGPHRTGSTSRRDQNIGGRLGGERRS